MILIPTDFVQRIQLLHGAIGRTWLEQLPAILNACEQRWEIKLGPPFLYLSYHYVAPAVFADGRVAVLKVHSPTSEFLREAEALRLFAGHGSAGLLAWDSDDHALLLEHLQPGTTLSMLTDDEEATTYAATVMQQLWHPIPPEHPFPTISDWGKGFERLHRRFDGGAGPFPEALVDRAERLFATLAASQAEPVLLHGDLHHENILAATRAPWLAIDPKGVVGEPAYEVGAFLRNPLSLFQERSRTRAQSLLPRRIAQLSEMLGFERIHLRDWGLAQAVLSAWWHFEDHAYLDDTFLLGAEILAALKV